MVAAASAASVAEPLLCSLGGGALAIVERAGDHPLVLDAFTQTPCQRRLDDLDFYPIVGNFGTDVQEFHIGWASVATPGVIAGLAGLHERFGRLPFAETLDPAIELARNGVPLNSVQRYAMQILEPIVRSTDEAARLFGLTCRQAPIPKLGACINNAQLADFLEQLGREGPGLFYQGEPARRLTEASVFAGGHLTLADLMTYRVHWRKPLHWRYRDADLWSAPAPAFGGMMLALACRLLATRTMSRARPGSLVHGLTMLETLQQLDDLRGELEHPALLASESALHQAFDGLIGTIPVCRRGTTHISIDDGRGLAIGLTLSNGECSGHVVPETGIMLNNMLGEEDINRAGFHRWPTNCRLASMMAPTLIRQNGRRWLLGSGGSNRIRSALTQVIAALIDFSLPLESAIEAARMHVEQGRLSIELPPGSWSAEFRDWLVRHQPEARTWHERNLYFGGVHAVGPEQACADPRRQGSARRAPWR